MSTLSIKPLFEEVVFFNNMSAKKIPGTASAYAGEDGKVYQIRSDGVIKRCPESHQRTTKGKYAYVKVVDDNFVASIKPVHRLVALAFHPKPSDTSSNYEPNHKNGNKLDNRPTNLEWLTHANNVQHAYNSGLTTQGLRIKVKDIQANVVREFHTLSHCAREMNIPRNTLRFLAGRHTEQPYLGRYLFELDSSSDRTVKRGRIVKLRVTELLTGKKWSILSYADASVLTGRKPLTIRYNVVENGFYLDDKYRIELDLSDSTPPSF